MLHPTLRLGFIAVFSILIFSCSSTKNASDSGSSLFPAWYQSSTFSSDSLGYSGYGTALASDSLEAIRRAETQARIHLEQFIADRTEEIREELESGGSENAGEPDFILTLRNAHAKVEGAARVQQSETSQEGNHYRGFVQASLSRTDLLSVMESGFSANPSYWEELNLADRF